MQAWTRTWSWKALAFSFAFAGLLSLRAADDAELKPPAELKLRLYQIEGSQTGKPDCPETLAFLKALLKKSFPNFDTFKLLLNPEQAVAREKTTVFTTGDFATTVTLLDFATGKSEDGKGFWKAKLQLECKTGDKVLYNPTIQILPGGQHIWAVDKIIFVLYLPEKDGAK